MEIFTIAGYVDPDHRLSAQAPESVPPGPVTILVVPTEASGEVEAGDAWAAGVAHEWRDDLADVRQDIYSLEDGEPVDAA